jgi:hypothetical protein
VMRAAATWPGPRPGGFAILQTPARFLLFLLLGGLSLLLTFLSNGHPLAAVLPIVGAATVWAIVKSPVRSTLFVLFFLGLSTDRPGDGNGMWTSSFVQIGALIHHNLSNTLPVAYAFLKLNGLTFVLLLLLVVRLHRQRTGQVLDLPGAVPAVPPMNWALYLSGGTLVWLVAWGLLNGGNIEMAKVQVQVMLPLLLTTYLLMPSLKVGRDYRTLGSIVVTAACCKAVMALWIRQVLPAATIDKFGVSREVEFATSHGDSLLFASAMLILFVPLIFEPRRRHIRRFLFIAPVIVAGLIANDRRLAWVQLMVGIGLALIMNPRSWMSRKLIRGTVLASPVLAVYIVAGWNLPPRVFRPVHTLKSMVSIERLDGTVDRSTLFRDVENYNLIYTFQQHPFGLGFGHPFLTPVANDDMSGFVEYQYLPHNSLLGLMGFAGGLGFLGLFAPLVVALFLAARGQRLTKRPEEAMAAAVAVGNIAAYLMHIWGDIGFTESTSIFTVGASYAIAGQVAVSSGAWKVAWPSLDKYRVRTEG